MYVTFNATFFKNDIGTDTETKWLYTTEMTHNEHNSKTTIEIGFDIQ